MRVPRERPGGVATEPAGDALPLVVLADEHRAAQQEARLGVVGHELTEAAVHAREHEVVAVEEVDPGPLGHLDAGAEVAEQAEVAGVPVEADPGPAAGLDHGLGVVERGAVVDHHDLGGLHPLVPQAGEGGPQERGAVVGGDQDREIRAVVAEPVHHGHQIVAPGRRSPGSAATTDW